MYFDDVINGRAVLVEGVPLRRLCNCLAEHSGITFTSKRRFFWSALDARAEFVFRGHAFKIKAVSLSRDFLVSPKEPGVELPEIITELRSYIAKIG